MYVPISSKSLRPIKSTKHLRSDPSPPKTSTSTEAAKQIPKSSTSIEASKQGNSSDIPHEEGPIKSEKSTNALPKKENDVEFPSQNILAGPSNDVSTTASISTSESVKRSSIKKQLEMVARGFMANTKELKSSMAAPNEEPVSTKPHFELSHSSAGGLRPNAALTSQPEHAKERFPEGEPSKTNVMVDTLKAPLTPADIELHPHLYNSKNRVFINGRYVFVHADDSVITDPVQERATDWDQVDEEASQYSRYSMESVIKHDKGKSRAITPDNMAPEISEVTSGFHGHVSRFEPWEQNNRRHNNIFDRDSPPRSEHNNDLYAAYQALLSEPLTLRSESYDELQDMVKRKASEISQSQIRGRPLRAPNTPSIKLGELLSDQRDSVKHYVPEQIYKRNVALRNMFVGLSVQGLIDLYPNLRSKHGLLHSQFDGYLMRQHHDLYAGMEHNGRNMGMIVMKMKNSNLIMLLQVSLLQNDTMTLPEAERLLSNIVNEDEAQDLLESFFKECQEDILRKVHEHLNRKISRTGSGVIDLIAALSSNDRLDDLMEVLFNEIKVVDLYKVMARANELLEEVEQMSYQVDMAELARSIDKMKDVEIVSLRKVVLARGIRIKECEDAMENLQVEHERREAYIRALKQVAGHIVSSPNGMNDE